MGVRAAPKARRSRRCGRTRRDFHARRKQRSVCTQRKIQHSEGTTTASGKEELQIREIASPRTQGKKSGVGARERAAQPPRDSRRDRAPPSPRSLGLGALLLVRGRRGYLRLRAAAVDRDHLRFRHARAALEGREGERAARRLRGEGGVELCEPVARRGRRRRGRRRGGARARGSPHIRVNAPARALAEVDRRLAPGARVR
jgi:hypothetical protein